MSRFEMKEPTREVPKIPSYMHLPWSPEEAREQKFMTEEEFNKEARISSESVIVTEKLDGSNVRLTRDAIHSRSNKDPSYEWYDRLKAEHSNWGWNIPDNIVLYGEWMYAKHSIKYTNLSNYLYVFLALDLNEMCWLSWDKTEELAVNLGVETVPIIDRYSRGFDEQIEPEGESVFGPTREGYVVRTTSGFHWSDFKRCVAKCVRHDHVSTDTHWRDQKIEPNKLSDSSEG